MHRRRYLAACGAGLTTLAGCNAPVGGGTTDPNTGLPVESSTRVVDDPVASGNAALRFSIDGTEVARTIDDVTLS